MKNNDLVNNMVLSLVQALCGAISPNFRMVTLCLDGETWLITFFIEFDNADDREEIVDVVAEFEALQSAMIRLNFSVIVSTEDLIWPEFPARVVFRRKE